MGGVEIVRKNLHLSVCDLVAWVAQGHELSDTDPMDILSCLAEKRRGDFRVTSAMSNQRKGDQNGTAEIERTSLENHN